MLDQSIRETIFRLRQEGKGARTIARALGLSRNAVKNVLALGTAEVPRLARAEKAEPIREQILELHASCEGNLVRVHEELLAKGAGLSYPALTAFCRRHRIGYVEKPPAGHYDFAPGQEMQHDTSPHTASIAGNKRRVQSASLVLCHSRMIFFRLYPTFTRFDCKVFLTDALGYLGGACKTCMIDNTHVVVLRGTGKEMVPVPEMAAFAERYGFSFAAHEVGDANRSARVERPFHFIENNFYAGRAFSDFDDANRQAADWCDKVNAKFSTRLHASRRELFAAERPHLVPLPLWVPPVYVLHDRIVDVEGYVSVRRNRYSVPYGLMGRRIEVRELKDTIEIYNGPRKVAEHRRLLDSTEARVTVPEHRPPRGEGRSKRGPCVEEQQILKAEPSLSTYIAALKQRRGGQGVSPLRRLLRMLRDYPRAPFLDAVGDATTYGLFDLDRLERMVLRRLGREYFVVPGGPDDPEGADEE
jgi:transposase